jgi:acyl carrier protein
MTRDEIKNCVLRKLTDIAPDVDTSTLEPATNFRDQFDFDSMDFLNFVIAVYKELKIEIPEADYPQLLNLDSAVNYLAAKLG